MDIKKRLNNLIACCKKAEKICVIGHDNIDVDATLSGILLAKLLNFLGLDADFEILQNVKHNLTHKIIYDLTNIDLNIYESPNENSLRSLVLVDHYKTTHEGTVIACIDHHPTTENNAYPFSYVRNCSATAFMIYELMEAANYPISADDAKLIIVSMMVDTVSFRSSKTISKEVEAAKALATKFNLDYDYLEKYCLCLTPIENMSIAEIVSNGGKKYTYNGHSVTSAYLQLYGMPDKISLNDWLHTLKLAVSNGIEMAVFIIFDLKNCITYEYRITLNSFEEIAHKGILSRGKDIMPKIEAIFN